MPELKELEINGTSYTIVDGAALHEVPTPQEVGARPDTWMPTAADVGAAPAGFGLGESEQQWVSDINTATKPGWYFLSASTQNVPAFSGSSAGNWNYASVFVEKRYTTIWQHFTLNYNDITVQGVRKSLDSGTTWEDMEYVNPPMTVGVEYRTTERIDGKAVYKKKDSNGAILYRLDGETEWKKQNALVGAAPAGFGLGGTGAEVADLDNATNNGWYWWTSGAVNAPFEYGSMIVLKRGTRITQLAFDPFMVGHGGIRVRHNNGTSWQAWQWLNPPMNVGSEYLLVERHQNKPVYTKLVNLGTLPNNTSKTVAHNIVETATFIGLEVFAKSSSSTIVQQFPLISVSGITNGKAQVSASGVVIYAFADLSGFTGHAILRYTKD